jgi:dTDP-4-dehydrorhamnose 3,5-epimerase-like enzyme
VPKLIKIPTFSDDRGSLSVVERLFKTNIKRVYFLHNLNGKARGQHGHKKTTQFLICLSGKIEILIKNKCKKTYKKYLLTSPCKGILLEPSDWHQIISRSKNTVVAVLASHYYNKKDYVSKL